MKFSLKQEAQFDNQYYAHLSENGHNYGALGFSPSDALIQLENKLKTALLTVDEMRNRAKENNIAELYEEQASGDEKRIKKMLNRVKKELDS